MGERFARLDFAGEREKGWPHRIAKPAVGDRHIEDRLSLSGNALPHPERLKQSAHRGNDRGSALVMARSCAAKARVDDGDQK